MQAIETIEHFLVFLLALVMISNTTWIYYVAIIHLKEVRDTLNMPSKFMAYLGLAVGFPLDVFLNLIFSILVLDLPREVTLTRHLSRLKKTNGWRGKVAMWICGELLDPYAQGGKHCS